MVQCTIQCNTYVETKIMSDDDDDSLLSSGAFCFLGMI